MTMTIHKEVEQSKTKLFYVFRFDGKNRGDVYSFVYRNNMMMLMLMMAIVMGDSGIGGGGGIGGAAQHENVEQ